MKLVAQLGLQITGVRDLTAAEISNHNKYVPVIDEARNRLDLFKIHQMNYREWRKYLDSLLSPRPIEEAQERLELNRLLLNYLATAYAIVEHFRKSYVQRFRRDPARENSHKKYMAEVCDHSFAFAFFLDFRDYVQHRGLAVGAYHRNVSGTSVSFSITQNAAQLLDEKNRSNWKNSKLSADKGDLDLVELLKEFHFMMIANYGKFVAETFFPELVSVAEFYGNLSKEAQRVLAGSRMIFVDDIDESNLPQFKINTVQVPNDLFQELGVSVRGTTF